MGKESDAGQQVADMVFKLVLTLPAAQTQVLTNININKKWRGWQQHTAITYRGWLECLRPLPKYP